MNEQATPAKRFSFDIGAAWLVAATTFLTIVAFVPGTSVSLLGTKVTIIFLGTLLIFIAFVVGRLVRGSIVVPPLLLLGALWFVPLAYALSTLFSGTNPVHAFFGTEFEPDTFGFVALLAVLASLTALVVRRTKDYQHLFLALGAGIALALLAQLTFLILGRVTMGLVSSADNVIGAFPDLGMLGGLAIALSLLTFRFFKLTVLKKTGLWIVIALAFLVIALVNSPLHFILIGLVALGLFIESLMRRRPTGDDAELAHISMLGGDSVSEGAATPAFIVSPLVVLLLSVFLLLGGSVTGNALASLTGVNVIDVRPSWRATFDVGSHTYASSPLFGSGPATFGEQWLMFRDRTLNDTVFWNLDFPSGIGYIPTSFVTTGAIGALAWIAFLGLFFFVGLRTFLFRLPEDTFTRFASMASFTGAAFVLALSFFATPGPVVLTLGFVLLGMFVSTLRFGKDRPEWGILFSRSPRMGFVIVFLLTLLLLASVAGAYVIAARYMASATYGSAFTAIATGNAEAAQNAIARSLSFGKSDRTYRLAAAIGIERMRAIAADTTLPATVAQQQFQQVLSESITAGLEATHLAPNDYRNWMVLGNVYQSVASLKISGAYESAKAAYERAVVLNPSTPVIPYVLGQLELGEGNTKAAEERLLASISLKRDYIPAILLLSQLKVQTGEAREALEAAEAAAYLAPNDPSVLFAVGLLRVGIGDMDGATVAFQRAVELNAQYANARFFLGAVYASTGKLKEALVELRTVSAMSEDNAKAVAADIKALEEGRNPFPQTRLRSLGIPEPPVKEPGAEEPAS